MMRPASPSPSRHGGERYLACRNELLVTRDGKSGTPSLRRVKVSVKQKATLRLLEPHFKNPAALKACWQSLLSNTLTWDHTTKRYRAISCLARNQKLICPGTRHPFAPRLSFRATWGWPGPNCLFRCACLFHFYLHAHPGMNAALKTMFTF